MFQTFIKTYQVNYHSKNWQKALQQREIMRNSYHAQGNIKKAREFVAIASQFKFQTLPVADEQIIFAKEMVEAPPASVITFSQIQKFSYI